MTLSHTPLDPDSRCGSNECFIQNGYNSEAASEAYFNRYPERRQPNMSIFGRLKENLVEYGGFNKPRPKNYRIQDAEDVAINVVGMVVVNPSISSRQIEAESGNNNSSLPTDPERRLDFCNWYLQQIEQDQLFFKNIIWTDESYVSSAGIFNRHNKHYWSEDNPHQTVDVQNQGRFGFSVWCALYNNRILAYQLYDDNLNGQRYYNMINYHIVEEFLDNLPLNERRHVFFQQDGAPPHNTNLISALLNT
ncbi:hypothetical protein NQ318_011226 [Aromia moschata]|uniref:Transposase n=1 Tax=Aromia moschata TaxID=1265417 RepID=A0AAV8YHP6_9CUCU|nr:hypothetical protein NQ318_011226 [Aromia moschata]